MDLKSYDELIMTIREERGRISSIKDRLDELSINPFSKDRFERRKLKRMLEKIRSRIEDYKEVIDDATTFKRYKLLNFFCEYLSLTERENIVVTKFTEVEENDNYSTGITYVALGSTLKNPGLTTLGFMNMMDEDEEETHYYVVSNEETSQALKYTFDNDMDAAIDEVDNVRCFYETEQIIHLADGTRLEDKYLVYPQLNAVFKRLVDLFLQYPDLSDEERFKKIIDETKGYKFINRY